jgi:hypothetical protein
MISADLGIYCLTCFCGQNSINESSNRALVGVVSADRDPSVVEASHPFFSDLLRQRRALLASSGEHPPVLLTFCAVLVT